MGENNIGTVCGKIEEWTLPLIFTKINQHQNKTIPCDFTKLIILKQMGGAFKLL